MKKTTLNHPFVMADRWALFFLPQFFGAKVEEKKGTFGKTGGVAAFDML